MLFNESTAPLLPAINKHEPNCIFYVRLILTRTAWVNVSASCFWCTDNFVYESQGI